MNRKERGKQVRFVCVKENLLGISVGKNVEKREVLYSINRSIDRAAIMDNSVGDQA
jgi:hypothetical protein